MKHAAATACLAVLAACGSSAGKTAAPAGTTTTTATAAPTPTTTAAPTTPTTASPPPGGSVVLNVRSPIQFAGPVTTAVVCDTERGHYAAEASGFMVGQDTVSMSVNISGYGGPRTYNTPVTVEFLAPNGTSDKVTENIAVKIVDPEHGQFTITGKDDLGKQIDADFNWSCT